MTTTETKNDKDAKKPLQVEFLEPIMVGRVSAAKLLGVCPRTVDNLAKRRALHARRIGVRVLFLRSELEAFAKRLGRSA